MGRHYRGGKRRPDSREPQPTRDFGRDELQAFVERMAFREAKSMPDAPHEYITRKDCQARDQQLTLMVEEHDGGDGTPDDKHEADFEAAVLFIRENGYKTRWGSKVYTYYDLEDADGQWWQYWSMGSPMHRTIILNRARIDGPNGEAA